MKKMRILVAGCGSIGVRHLTCLSGRSEAVELSATDPSPDAANRLKALNGAIPFFSDYAEALARSPELVIVCAPTNGTRR
jgi:predicted dehydrogenase